VIITGIMEQTYSVSSVVGFNDHIGLKLAIKLPLKYENRPIEEKSPNDIFNDKLGANGGIIRVGNSMVDNVSWQVLNDMKTIVLTPINLKKNSFDLDYQKLIIELPNRIGSKCISVQYSLHDDIDNEGFIIIDLLDENYLLISLKLDIPQFYNSSEIFTLDRFHEWGNISVPYSFELRSVPFSLKSIDSLNLIVSLKDGGLLHFKRSTILKDFDVYNFNDTSTLLPLNFLGGLFKLKNSGSNSVVEGINSNCIVDVLLIAPHEIVTLSVSKQLKIWNLNSHQSSIAPISLGENSDNSWLTTIPTKHLQMIEDENNKKFLTCQFTSASKDQKSAFQITAHEISCDNNNFELSQLGSSENLEIPFQDNLDIQSQNINWFIQDFSSEIFDDFILYHILWKSYTSSILTTYQHNISGGVERLYSSFTGPTNNSEEFNPYHQIDYYIHKVLNSGRYNNLILQTSLNILRDHYKVNSYIHPSKSIRSCIQETIHQIAVDPKLVWFKLDSLCEEYRKMSEEVLGLNHIGQNKFLVLQANGIESFGLSHYFEKVFFPESIETSEFKLGNILKRITSSVSKRTCHKLSEKVRHHGKLSITDTDELYETYLKSRFSDGEVLEIIAEMSSIPNYTDILNSFVNLKISKPSEFIHYSTSQPDQLSPLRKLTTIATIKDIIEQHEYILSTLLVMFLLFGGTEDNVNYINDIIDKLNSYETFKLVLDTCFKSFSPFSPIEDLNISNLEYSLFWSAIVKGHPELNYRIETDQLNDAFNYIFIRCVKNYENMIADVTIDLINRGEGKFIRETYFPKLSNKRPIDRFLMGLVFLINDEPDKFFDIFKNYQNLQMHKDKEVEAKIKTSLSIDPSIKDFLNVIFTREDNPIERESNYYHALSVLAKARVTYHKKQSPGQMSLSIAKTNLSNIETEFLSTALDFENKSIELLKQIQTPSQSVLNKIDSHFIRVFELSLKLTKYDYVYDALSNISPDNISEECDYEQLFTKFIRNLIANQSLSIIFPPNMNALYKKNFLLIDGILLKLANNEIDLAGSRRIYEYLYSWRLFGISNELSSSQLADKRGAIEALYMFITRFRFESNLIEFGATTTVEASKQFKLKILELYMIIINCLKSFENDDDKWILKQDKQSNKLLKLDDIKIEYFEWIKELERELHEF
jgi:nuclear pore complex protein Nup160